MQRNNLNTTLLFCILTAAIISSLMHSCIFKSDEVIQNDRKRRIFDLRKDLHENSMINDSLTTGVPHKIVPDTIRDLHYLPLKMQHPDTIVVDANIKQDVVPDTIRYSVHKEFNDVKPVTLSLSPDTVPFIYTDFTKSEQPGNRTEAHYDISYFDIDHGLVSGYLNEIVLDSSGFLWMSSPTDGIARFDGTKFSNYTLHNGLPGNSIQALAVDNQNRLWIATKGEGISCFNGEYFINYKTEAGLPSNFILSLYVAKNGDVWMGFDGDGVGRFDGNQFYHYNKENNFIGNYVTAIHEDQTGSIWFSTFLEGVLKLKNQKVQQFNYKSGWVRSSVFSMYSTEKGDLWMGTANFGALKLENDYLLHYNKENGLVQNSIRSIIEDSHGRIWMATPGGISMLEDHRIENFTVKEGLSANNTTDLIEDLHGNVWSTSLGGGINRIRYNGYRHFSEMQGLPSVWVNQVDEDKEGNVWIATSKGLVKYDHHEITHFTPELTSSNNNITCVYKDDEDRLWISSAENGLGYLVGDTLHYLNHEFGLMMVPVNSMVQDNDGSFWLGTDMGIYHIKDSTIYNYTIANGLHFDKIEIVKKSPNGTIWFGTDGGGAISYSEGKFTFITKKEGLTHNSISDFIFESKRTWISTHGGGIHVWDGRNFHTITEADGLNSTDVLGMIKDSYGNIWIGTKRGYYIMKKINNNKDFSINNYQIRLYNKWDGIHSDDLLKHSFFEDHHQNMWIFTGKSLSFIDINNVNDVNQKPNINLHKISLSHYDIDFRLMRNCFYHDEIIRTEQTGKGFQYLRYDGVTPHSNVPINLELPFDANNVSFYFSGIDYESPHRIQYSYRLLGLENKWSPLTSETNVSYSNLSPGKYTFELKALSADNIWSDELKYTFNVRYPWWLKWWMIIIEIILAAFLVFLIIRWWTKRLLKKQEKLEAIIDERTAEVVNQKEIIEQKSLEIIDSINYAKHLQAAILPNESLFRKYFKNSLVYFRPKDIVSGDFYWLERNGDYIFFAAADCTGHGVPGAMVSVVCSNALFRAVKEYKLTEPGKVLDKVTEIVEFTFDKAQHKVKDGMDISLCAFHIPSGGLQWAGANNPLWLISDGELHEFKANKQPIGKFEHRSPFTTHDVEIKKGDLLYMFSDGYPDQFGGEAFDAKKAGGKKFKAKNFKKLLLENHEKTMQEQRNIIDDTFEKWKGDLEQIDDVCVIGIRI